VRIGEMEKAGSGEDENWGNGEREKKDKTKICYAKNNYPKILK